MDHETSLQQRNQDIQDLLDLIGRRNLERCGECDRYILSRERSGCPHCTHKILSGGLGRIKDHALLGQHTEDRQCARAEVGRELLEIANDFKSVPGSGVLPMALDDFGLALIEGRPLLNQGHAPWHIDAEEE